MIHTLGSFFSGISLFVCVGAILLVVLAFMAIRALTGPRSTGGSPTLWNQRGPEQPRYDNPDVDAQGGFGSIPSTGPTDPLEPGGLGSPNPMEDDNDLPSSAGR